MAICPTRISTCGRNSSSSAWSQLPQFSMARLGGGRSPMPEPTRPGKQRISPAMYVSRRTPSSEANPAVTIQRPSSRPARPENGCRLWRSTGPGACPIRKKGASARPANTGAASGMMPSSTHFRQALQAACRALSSFSMLRLGPLRATQGRGRVDALPDLVCTRCAAVDELWHAGDWQEEAVLEGLRGLGKPLTVVNGNAPDDPRFPIQVRRSLEGLEVGMVHRPPRTGDVWAAGLDLCIH